MTAHFSGFGVDASVRARRTLQFIPKVSQRSTQFVLTLRSMARLGQSKSAIPNTFTLNRVSLQHSSEHFTADISVNLFAGMNLLGIPTQFDPNDGTSAGPAFVPTDLDPTNQTRSDARRTYYDPYVGRANFHVITGQHVTRILTAGVGGNNAVSSPTTGGNENGDGPSAGNNDGFGFGPGGSTPPLAPPASRFARRQDPATSNLRITGVEVSGFEIHWCHS